jgi:tetratricopeptide (TPR) repeat protein
MKKVLLTVLLAGAGFGLYAQKIDKAKDLLSKKKYTEAKTEIDAVVASEKFANSSEAWYQKAKIYGAIANDSTLKASVPDARDVSFEAIKKYLELESKEKDEKKRYLLLTFDGNQPLIDVYSGYSKNGASFYNAGNYNDALANFKKTLGVFDVLAERGIVPMKLDTTTTLYAGISAEKASKPDEAAIYYSKIAEAKAKSEGFVEIYKWLADHYRQKNDIATAQKFSALGKSVYPEDQFWTGFDLEMLSDKGTKADLFKKYEDVIKENPDNHIFLFNYAVELYKEGYQEDVTKRPANSKELINKAGEMMKRTLEKKPDYANANMVMGQILYNQGVDINTENKAIRPQGGAKLTPDQLKKKEELRQEVVKKFDEATPYFEKVDELLDKQAKLKMEDKEILKNALDLLITINEEKTAQLETKRNAAETAKKAAEVKQYEADIKKLQDKTTAYTEKFNNVDRKH